MTTVAGFPLTALAGELAESADRLDALDAGEVTADLRAVFSTSCNALEPEEARAFALLGLAPGSDFGVPAAASLLAASISRVRGLLRTLEAAHLIRQHAPGRYQFHDLVHLFAAERAHQDQNLAEHTTALRRLADFYLHTAHHAAGHLPAPSHVLELVLDPPTTGCAPHRCADAASAREWFDAEYLCLQAAHQLTREYEWHTLTWQLPAVLIDFCRLRGRGLKDLDTWQISLDAAQRLDDPDAEATARHVLGTVCAYTGRNAQAQEHLEQALTLFEETGNLPGQADTLFMLGTAWEKQEDPRRALSYNERALLLYQTTGNVRWETRGLNSVGWKHAMLGNYEQARTYCADALAKSRTTGDQTFEVATLDSLGYVAHHMGDYLRALDYYQQSLILTRKIRFAWAEAEVLRHLGETYFSLGQFAASRRAWQQALDLCHTQHRIADTVRLQEHLDTLDRQEAECGVHVRR